MKYGRVLLTIVVRDRQVETPHFQTSWCLDAFAPKTSDYTQQNKMESGRFPSA